MNLRNYIEENGLEALGRFYGVYTGVVIQDYDPENIGRLLVRIPEVKGESVAWASPMGMISGKGYGEHYIPATNEWVYIMFRNGDPKFPLWLPGGYAKGEKPQEFHSNSISGFKSLAGHLFTLDDEKGLITIRTKSGVEITINDQDKTLKANGHHLADGDNLKAQLEDLAKIFDTTNATVFIPNPTIPGSVVINAATFKTKIQDWVKSLEDILTKYA